MFFRNVASFIKCKTGIIAFIYLSLPMGANPKGINMGSDGGSNREKVRILEKSVCEFG